MLHNWIVRVDIQWSGEESYFVQGVATAELAKGEVYRLWRERKREITLKHVRMSVEQVKDGETVTLVAERSYDFD